MIRVILCRTEDRGIDQAFQAEQAQHAGEQDAPGCEVLTRRELFDRVHSTGICGGQSGCHVGCLVGWLVGSFFDEMGCDKIWD